VEHDISLSVRDMSEALDNAGFDVFAVTAGAEAGAHNIPSGKGSVEPGYIQRIMAEFTSDSRKENTRTVQHSLRHLQNCESCRLEAAGKTEAQINFRPSEVSSEGNLNSMENVREEATGTPFVVIEPSDSQDLWQANVAIGGMTCAACVGTIAEELKKKSWVKKAVINLISNSGTVDFIGEEHKIDLIEAIEDIGYDAVLDSVTNLNPQKRLGTEGAQRTVEILVPGIYCSHCPGKVLNSVRHFGDTLCVEKPLTLHDPILKLRYTPNTPDLTIRHILGAITAIDPLFEPTIFHPPTLEERSRQIRAREQFRILARVLLTLIIAIPTFIIGIVYMSLVPADNHGKEFLMKPFVSHTTISRAQWALFILASPVYFFCADVFHKRALKEIRSMWRPGSATPLLRRFYRFGSMSMLMSLGTSVAYFSSVAQLIHAGVDRSVRPSENSFYFDSVVFLTLFLLIGRLIEAYSKSKTGDAVAMLGKLRPTKALLVESKLGDTVSEESIDGSRESLKLVNVDLLEIGDVVKVLHGASPPCDGIIVVGESKFDESSLTGESKLIKKSVGDHIFSGTVNKESPISMRITGAAGSSMLDQIVNAVREGQTRRAPMERIADTLTSYFVPFVICVAITTWVIWLALGTSGVLPHEYLENYSGGWVAWSLQFAISVFVVACPCGLGLAAPTALYVGGGLAAKNGILAKGGGEAFEKASKLDCIVFDKTGTLTIGGEPVVTDHRLFSTDLKHTKSTAEPAPENAIFGMVRALEVNSSHTVAKAMVSFCQESFHIPVEGIEEIAGQGMKGTFNIASTSEKVEILVGNEALLNANSVLLSNDIQTTLEGWKSEGKSIALSAVKVSPLVNTSSDNLFVYKIAAIFAISDPIRPEAPGVIRGLLARGTDVWMLSGDNEITAKAIGAQIGIPDSNIIAGILPSQKADKIQYLQKSLKSCSSSTKRALIAMVGDGINDSPALTTADVGIAIGSGSDIAISSAEFVLVRSNLNTLITLLDLSKVVFRRIKFNFVWALVYNMLALPVAAGVLYPIVKGGSHVRLDPVWASLAMAASSISVVMSSLALRSGLPVLGFRPRKEVVEE
jgi:heavy metal translocating P-type ATPase